MNALLPLTGDTMSMTSREIADLVRVRHDSVKRTIERLVNQGVIAQPPTVNVQEAGGNNRTYVTQQYLFCGEQGKRDSIVVVAQLSPEFTAALVDRWKELEDGLAAKKPAEMSRMEILQIAMAAEAGRLEAEAKLALAAPKVTYANAMLNADGTVLVRDAAKTIGVPVRKLEKALREKGVILPDNAPAARYVTQGYFKEAVHTYETNTRGMQFSRVARVTGLGLEFLRRFVLRHAELFARPSARRRTNGGAAPC
ncbi:phage antirepressor KilAC domain-containing protein [Alicycliphilus denitrificans]|uniref:phage antirepressor KilAC domain-containing protein n=1 Tax=Alicycliphilus denitrificans TaxID=179636 RepID=UPI000C9F4DBA|nr:phage antirepressor KilAC domain-containing protein [Alicycliphilus denitrificans]